jgi:HK97 family phage major capsid protein
MAMVTIEELQARLTELRGRITELDNEYAGQAFPSDAEEEWSRCNQQIEETEALIRQLTVRQERIEALSERPENREAGATFNTPKSGTVRGDDIYDLTTVRGDANNPSVMGRELRERANRHIERMVIPHEKLDHPDPKGHIERILRSTESENGELSRYFLAAGSPAYERAFWKALQQRPLTAEETQAMVTASRAALGIGAAGTGLAAVPIALDPTVVPASSGALNPFRQISRVVQTTSAIWRGLTSVGITAAYHAEATEATDNAPTLVQPELTPEKAHAFVPFSVEVGEDWTGLQSELARMFADAKDELEATKFALGAGVGSSEPQGVIVGATTTVDSATKDAFAVADVYALESALPARYLGNARFIAHQSIFARVRQFDTYGGANMWTDLPGPNPSTLIGYPAHKVSTMETSLATGKLFLCLGDFSRFLIVDRVGMSIELIPHLVGGVANYPTGQRGYFAYWRNTSQVLVVDAFRVTKGKA